MRKFNVKVNGQPYEVEIEEIAEGFYVAPVAPVMPAPTPVKAAAPVVAQVAAPAPAAAPTAAQGNKLLAPMPGTIVGFKVEAGATVKKGQAVIILEAMKMENEIAACNDGVISFVTTKGSSVNTGDVLAVIA